jgi:hypothetical protein
LKVASSQQTVDGNQVNVRGTSVPIKIHRLHRLTQIVKSTSQALTLIPLNQPIVEFGCGMKKYLTIFYELVGYAQEIKFTPISGKAPHALFGLN